LEARRKKEEKVEDGERTIPKKVEKEQTETASIPTCFTRRHKKPQKRKGSDRQKRTDGCKQLAGEGQEGQKKARFAEHPGTEKEMRGGGRAVMVEAGRERAAIRLATVWRR
jgi:hypothetical protein